MTFKAGVTAVRYMSSAQQLFSAEVSKHTWLARNDLNMATLFGRAFRIQRPSGIKMVSQASYYDVSDLLDGIWQLKGGILVRDANQWKGLAAGPDDYVLTSNGPNEVPSWQPPAGGGAGNGRSTFQLTNSTTTSATAFAFKGLSWAVDYDVEISGIWVYGDQTAGHVWKAMVGRVSNTSGAGVLDEIHLGQAITLPETLGDRWQWLPMVNPVTLHAGDKGLIGAGRSDSTGTFAFPINGFGTGTYWFPLPGRPRRLVSIASANPTVGMAYTDGATVGAPGLGMEYSVA